MTSVIALGIEALVLMLAGAAFLSLFFARRMGAPFFPTPSAAISGALREANLHTGESFYDLGAGTGKALIIAEKEFGARATGFEISTLVYLIAQANLFLHRSRAAIVKKNFFDADLKNADVVFCFLAIRTMQKMEDKIKAELKPGARIIVYAFPLPAMTPTKTIVVHGQWKMFLYRID